MKNTIHLDRYTYRTRPEVRRKYRTAYSITRTPRGWIVQLAPPNPEKETPYCETKKVPKLQPPT